MIIKQLMFTLKPTLRFANSRLGWDKQKVDENLLPVLKRMNQRQVNIYFVT